MQILKLLFLFFIGKPFYKLAGENKKQQWPYAILGIVTFLVGTSSASIIITSFFDLTVPQSADEINLRQELNLLSIPLGLIICFGVYHYLKENWKTEIDLRNENILDSDFDNEDF